MDKKEIIGVLKEMWAANAACFRVIVFQNGLVDELEVEYKRIGVKDGFGLRCQNLIDKLEKE